MEDFVDVDVFARAREDGVEVFMFNSKKGARVDGRDLIFLKGGWEFDEIVFEVVVCESMEEGGVVGMLSVLEKTYEFVSRSRVKVGCVGDEVKCVVYVFIMEVKCEYEMWFEEGE